MNADEREKVLAVQELLLRAAGENKTQVLPESTILEVLRQNQGDYEATFHHFHEIQMNSGGNNMSSGGMSLAPLQNFPSNLNTSQTGLNVSQSNLLNYSQNNINFPPQSPGQLNVSSNELQNSQNGLFNLSSFSDFNGTENFPFDSLQLSNDVNGFLGQSSNPFQQENQILKELNKKQDERVQFLESEQVKFKNQMQQLMQLLQKQQQQLQQQPTSPEVQQPSQELVVPKQEVNPQAFGNVQIGCVSEPEYPFAAFTTTNGTVRPFPAVAFQGYEGNKQELMIIVSQAQNSPNNFTIGAASDVARWKGLTMRVNTERQLQFDVIVCEELVITGVGDSTGKEIILEFRLVNIQGMVELARCISPPVVVYNHPKYTPSPVITKLFPAWSLCNTTTTINVYGQLFLKKGKLWCKMTETNGSTFWEQNSSSDNLKQEKKEFHHFWFTGPVRHEEGTVLISVKYGERDYGQGKPFYYLNSPPQVNQNENGSVINELSPESPASPYSNPNTPASPGSQSSSSNPASPTVDQNGMMEISPYALNLAFQGNLPELKKLLSQFLKKNKEFDAKTLFNVKDKYGNTPLYWAAFQSNIDVVEYLVEDIKVDVNNQNERLETPLHAVSYNGNVILAKLLLKGGSDPNIKNSEGQLPIHISAASGHTDLLMVLIREIENLEIGDNEKFSPLHYAAMTGKSKTTALLVRKMKEDGYDIDCQDCSGWTALHWACSSGHLDTVNILIKGNADVNVVDKNKESPLFVAVSSQNIELFHILMEAGCKLDVQNSLGQLPLDVDYDSSQLAQRIDAISLESAVENQFKSTKENKSENVKQEEQKLEEKIQREKPKIGRRNRPTAITPGNMPPIEPSLLDKYLSQQKEQNTIVAQELITPGQTIATTPGKETNISFPQELITPGQTILTNPQFLEGDTPTGFEVASIQEIAGELVNEQQGRDKNYELFADSLKKEILAEKDQELKKSNKKIQVLESKVEDLSEQLLDLREQMQSIVSKSPTFQQASGVGKKLPVRRA